jgi:hypothetical protein
VQEFVLASKFAFYNGISTLSEQEFMTSFTIFLRMWRIRQKVLVDHGIVVVLTNLIDTREYFLSRSEEQSPVLLCDAVEVHCG